MLTIAYYFLQVALCSAVMMGYYWLVLCNRRFHQYNRFYLLSVALLPWLIPFVKIPLGFFYQPGSLMVHLVYVVAGNNSYFEQTVAAKGVQINWNLLVITVYALVSAILLTGFMVALYRVFALLKKYSCKNLGEVYLILTQAKGTPFSFFRYIFWNEKISLHSALGQQMMQHELTHVREKHSVDKIIIQIVLIAGWFNPFFWLLKREMNMVHEFIADHKAFQNGDTASLAAMLLAAAYPQQQFALTNPFFFSPIKRRLQMLAINKNPRFSYMRRLVALPLLAIVVLLLAFRMKENNNALSNHRLSKTYTVVVDAGHGGTDFGATAIDGKTHEKDIALAIAKAIKDLNSNDQLRIILTRESDLFNSVKEKAEMAERYHPDLFISLHSQEVPANDKASGAEVFISKKTDQELNAQNQLLASNILTKLSPAIFTNNRGITRRDKGIWILDEAGYPAVLVETGFLSNKGDLAIITSKKKQKEIAGAILSGVQGYLAYTETHILTGDTLIVNDSIASTVNIANISLEDKNRNIKRDQDTVIKFHNYRVGSIKDALIVIDGEKSNFEVMSKINPQDIDHINVLKGKSGALKYNGY